MSPRSGPNAPGIAFITGGARGLGNAIAVSFAKEGALGVVIVDIQDEATFKAGKEAVEAEGAKCLTIHADVTKEEEVERAVKRAVEEFGRIDYAANFAGVLGSGVHISELSLADYERTMGVNATGVFLATKWELKQMMGQDASPGVYAFPTLGLSVLEAKLTLDDTLKIQRRKPHPPTRLHRKLRVRQLPPNDPRRGRIHGLQACGNGYHQDRGA
jgi:NAD(P)-dependent dehydrogenase (short-subunit alcohol dehydrogenase family)